MSIFLNTCCDDASGHEKPHDEDCDGGQRSLSEERSKEPSVLGCDEDLHGALGFHLRGEWQCAALISLIIIKP